MSLLKYEEIHSVSHDEAEANLASEDVELMARTLIALGLYDDDWEWVQEQGVKHLGHKNEVVVSAAILSIAHMARTNGKINKSLVLPALIAVAVDKRYEGRVQDAIDDIEMFVKP